MKMTLLEIVQDILDSMSSFDVNSITDTLESTQVASIVRGAYYDIIQLRDWQYLKRLMQLDTTSTSTPTHLKIPDNIKRVDNIAYNVKKLVGDRDDYRVLRYLEPEQFLAMSNGLNSTAANVDSVTDFGGATILVRNNKQPEYWTSFDDVYVVCDSYYSTLDNNLQNSKTRAMVVKSPSWTHDDNEYPDLPEEAFPYLVNEAKSRAWLELRGIPHEKAEQSANRHRRAMSQRAWQLNSGDKRRTYGRKRPGVSRNPYLEK